MSAHGVSGLLFPRPVLSQGGTDGNPRAVLFLNLVEGIQARITAEFAEKRGEKERSCQLIRLFDFVTTGLAPVETMFVNQ